jgi:LysM repeat protein
MDNNESNPKPQSTGGLKLMTVFIAVLALHVIVIGGYSIYQVMKGGAADADLADTKAAKDAKVSTDGSVVMDGQLPDGSQPDKTTAAESAAPAPAIEQAPPAETPAAPAPAPVAVTPDASTPTGPVVTPAQAPAPAPTLVTEQPMQQPTEQMEPTTAPPLEPEAAAAPVVRSSYVVKMHDTLEKIALRHHTTVATLKRANGLKGELLHVGERLSIPGKREVAAAPATDGTGATNLSGTPVMTPDETVAAPAHAPSGSHTYTVVKGDTLTRIAHKFRTTAKALMAVNNITDPTKLSIGKKLLIPSHEAQATTTVMPVPVQAPAPAAVQPAQPKTTAQLANFVQ